MATEDSTSFVLVPCGKGQFTKLDKADADALAGINLSVSAEGYVIFNARVHRMLLRPPADMVVDHINGDRLDNRRANLRVCTQTENLANGRPHRDGKSKYRGVCFRKREGTWRAQISLGGQKSKYLGQYPTEEEAAMAYDHAARVRYGEFARLNFPSPSASHQATAPYLTKEERRALNLPRKRVPK